MHSGFSTAAGRLLSLAGLLIAGALASCSVSDTGVASGAHVRHQVARAGEPAIKLTAYYFRAPDGFHFGKKHDTARISGVYSAEEGSRLAKSLSRRRGFEPIMDGGVTVVSDSGDTSHIELIREFVYPSEYLPAETRTDAEGRLEVIHPSTPCQFEERVLGPILTCKGRSAEKGKVVVDLALARTAFVGFVNYGDPITRHEKGFLGFPREVVLFENRIDMPVFHRSEVKGALLVNEGDFIAIDGFRAESPTDNDRFEAHQPFDPLTGGGNFVALIQVGRNGE